MQVGLHTRLKPGAEERYEEYHRAVWPDVLKAIQRVGISKYVIFRDGLDLFHYIECDDYDRAIAELATDPVNIRWQAEMAPMMAKAHDFSGQSSDRLPKIFDQQCRRQSGSAGGHPARAAHQFAIIAQPAGHVRDYR